MTRASGARCRSTGSRARPYSSGCRTSTSACSGRGTGVGSGGTGSVTSSTETGPDVCGCGLGCSVLLVDQRLAELDERGLERVGDGGFGRLIPDVVAILVADLHPDLLLHGRLAVTGEAHRAAGDRFAQDVKADVDREPL